MTEEDENAIEKNRKIRKYIRNKRAHEELNENSDKKREINREYMKRADESQNENCEALAKKRKLNREYLNFW